MGLYGHHKSVQQGSSLVPCSDMCGTIVKVGGNGSSGLWKEGDRVVSIFNQQHLKGQVSEKDMASGLELPLSGVLTQYRVFPAAGLVTVPDYLSDEEASTLPIAAVTAWMSINWMHPIGQPVSGKSTCVLLQGTGGVSISGLQIAKSLNLTSERPRGPDVASAADYIPAIVTSSSDTKLASAKKLGADHVINYKSIPEWHKEVLRFTNERGADIILETGGAQTLPKSFECVAFGGLISCIGYVSGKEDAPENRINTNVLALKRNVTLKGILNGPRERFEKMLELAYTKNRIHPVIDKVFEFAEAREALEYLYDGSHLGKVVLKVS